MILTMPAPTSRDPEQLVARFRRVFDMAAREPSAEPLQDRMTLRAVEAIADEAVEELRRDAWLAERRRA